MSQLCPHIGMKKYLSEQQSDVYRLSDWVPRMQPIPQFPHPCLYFYPAVWSIFLCVQIRDKKRAALLKEKRSSIGSSGAPRVIVSVLGFSLRFHLVTLVVSCGQASSSCKVNYFQVLVGLSSSSNVGSLAKDLLTFAEGCDGKLRSSTVASPTYKLRTTVSSK